jgi:hypothetical protein
MAASTPTMAVDDKDESQIIDSTNLHDVAASESNGENANASNNDSETALATQLITGLRTVSKRTKVFKSFLTNDSDAAESNLFKHHQQLPLTRSISLRANRNFTIAQHSSTSTSVKTSNSMKYENAQQYQAFAQQHNQQIQHQQQLICNSTQSANRRMALLSQSSCNSQSTTFSDIIENEMKLENFIGSITNFK